MEFSLGRILNHKVQSSQTIFDFIFFDWNGTGSSDHVGIVIENHAANSYLITIEGNTSPEGAIGASQQNGGGVYQRKRYLGKTIIAVARPAWTSLSPTK